MKSSAEFRKNARNALRGKWFIAVLTGFVASLFGATIVSNSGVSIGNNRTGITVNFPESEFLEHLQPFLIVALIILAIWGIVTLIVGGAAQLGYTTFNLRLIDNKEVFLSDLFSQFHRLGTGFAMEFFRGLFTILWTFLFIIPGIIKSYSYAMTPYILAENPDMTARKAITESRRIMNGNKWRLFCLEISFIGWKLLCSMPLLIAMAIYPGSVIQGGNPATLIWIILCGIISFIGALFLNPYQEVARAAFYREVAETSQST